MKKSFGAAIATAVAGMLVTSAVHAEDAKPAAGDKPAAFCQNNSCKGKSACKGHGNDACKGQNSCKGHGFLEAADAKGCKKAGGKWQKG